MTFLKCLDCQSRSGISVCLYDYNCFDNNIANVWDDIAKVFDVSCSLHFHWNHKNAIVCIARSLTHQSQAHRAAANQPNCFRRCEAHVNRNLANQAIGRFFLQCKTTVSNTKRIRKKIKKASVHHCIGNTEEAYNHIQ